MGARSFLPKQYKRAGRTTKVEQELVKHVLQDSPAEITDKQITALAKTMRRSKEAVRTLVENARQDFAERADFYLDSHKAVVEKALDNIDDEDQGAKYAEVAMKATQWAIESISIEGQRIVDKGATTNGGGGSTGINIMIGVKTDSKATATAVKVEATAPSKSAVEGHVVAE